MDPRPNPRTKLQVTMDVNSGRNTEFHQFVQRYVHGCSEPPSSIDISHMLLFALILWPLFAIDENASFLVIPGSKILYLGCHCFIVGYIRLSHLFLGRISYSFKIENRSPYDLTIIANY